MIRYPIIYLLFVGCFGFGQTVSKQVIGPGGQTFENGNNNLRYSVGEVAVGAMTDEEGGFN